jgi:hypothetical protein
MTQPIQLVDISIEEKIQEDLFKSTSSKRQRIFSKIFGAALGSIPWVGGFISAIADFRSDEKSLKSNHLYEQWLTEHKKKIKILAESLNDIVQRLDEFPEEIDERLESEEYLQLVRKAFKTWDNADTLEKRELIRKLLGNAGAYKLVPDDLIRLFLDWIVTYHEIHFAVIKAIHQAPGITRYEIWHQLNGEHVRENSLEADLFKLLVRDLSTGSVIRQHRVTDYYGNFVKRSPQKGKNSSAIMKSAFDDQEGYELTELGAQFVHYTMNEVVKSLN